MAGKFEDIYKLGDQYGGAAWDAMGGDFSGWMDLANAGALYGANKMFGEAFGAQGTQAAVGSQAGMAYGGTIAGPLGMIVGGAAGAIGGDIVNMLAGNKDVDYDFRTSAGTEGFEDGKYISTPFGNIGFNASSTRNLSMNKMGNPMLSAYSQILGPVDMQLASVLNEGEMGQVRAKMEGNIENAHRYDPQYSMQLMLKNRMSAINSVMSDERKAETGWNDMLAQYNEQYAPADRATGELITSLQERITAGEQFEDADNMSLSNFQLTRLMDGQAAQRELTELASSNKAAAAILADANSPNDSADRWWMPTGISDSVMRYYNRIDETNARLRV